MAEKKKPAHEVKLGRIRAAIWANRSEDSDTWYNVTVSRLYKDEGEWCDAVSFRRDDIPIVIKAMDMAYEWIWRRQIASSEPVDGETL